MGGVGGWDVVRCGGGWMWDAVSGGIWDQGCGAGSAVQGHSEEMQEHLLAVSRAI